MNPSVAKGFFAFPSTPPNLREAIFDFQSRLNRSGDLRVQTWEECRVGGKLIIQEICKAIDSCQLFLADLTGLNANVMFELGYAIATDKRIWLVLDTSFEKQRTMFEQMRLLTTVGYAPCLNSNQMVEAFYKDAPFHDIEDTIYKETIEPSIRDTGAANILYLQSRHANQASIRLTETISRTPCGVIIDDPQESSVRSLPWYGEHVASAAGVLCHLTNPDREGSRLEIAKYSLVAGLAFGFGRNLLMLAEGDFLAPVDYRDLLKHYHNAGEAVEYAEAWLAPLDHEELLAREVRGTRISQARLAIELKGLYFGDYVAENESAMLVDSYFVPTAAYEQALRGTHAVFVGRKGSGKTANLLKLGQELGRDRRNLVCQIKPAAYEMQGIVELLRKYRKRDTKGYAIASLWKYLLCSEMAREAATRLEGRDPATHSDRESAFLRYIELHKDFIQPEFSVRIERCVDRLIQNPLATDGSDVEATRAAISETLHGGILSELRRQTTTVLQNMERVVILVDNLDKAWDKAADFDLLAEVLLGLLGAAGDIPRDFHRQNSRQTGLSVSLITFLRSDIFYKVRQHAIEPDKIQYTRLEWSDRALLAGVIEKRFMASHAGEQSPNDLWTTYFCQKVDGALTRDYVLDVIQARPRDLIYFINAAVSTAVNRRHSRVEAEDILEAEKQYSLYALESIIVENTLPELDLEAVLFEFAGARSILTEAEALEIIGTAGVDAGLQAETMKVLCGLTFLGIEVDDNTFAFAEDPQRFRRDEVRARRHSEKQRDMRRYKIHPAFRAFLEIEREHTASR